MARPKDTEQYTHKTCIDCKVSKPLAELSNGKRCTMGKRALCRKCNNERLKKTYWNNPDKFRARTRNASRGNQRRWNLRRYFGMSLEDYDRILAKQGGGCAICGSKDSGKTGKKSTKWLHIDHCHATGKIRGLLCINCNNGLGRFKDDPSKLRAAIEYLEKHIMTTN